MEWRLGRQVSCSNNKSYREWNGDWDKEWVVECIGME